MRRAAYGLILLMGIVRLAVGLWLGFRPLDDAYITFRYARNLASGFGFVYNIGEPVLGTTSPLWAMVLALMGLVHLPLEMGSMVLSLVMDVTTAVLLFRLLTSLDYDASTGLAAAALFLCWFDYLSLARSGMETSCFVLLTVASLEAIVSRRFVRAAVCSALACLARPEGALLAILFAFALARAWRNLPRKELVASVALFLVIGGGWIAYAFATFGSFIPQSVIAKAAIAGDPELKRFSWQNLALFFLKGQYGGDIFERTYLQLMPAITVLSAVAAAALLIDMLRAPRGVATDRVMGLLFFPVCYVAGLALSHAFTVFPWYYGPIYPFAAALPMVGVVVLSQGNSRLVPALCVLLIAAQLAAAWRVKLPDDRSFWVEGYRQVAGIVPRDRALSVAAPEIGTVGWAVWPARIVDLAGLVTPGAVGMAEDEYVRSVKPEYVILRTDNGAAFLARAERASWFEDGYQLVATRRDPYVDREFRAYRVRR